MKIIGLTGGIGSGKSVVSRVFLSMGIPVFDADAVAKSLYDEPEVAEIIRLNFGAAVFDEHQLDRKKLAAIVFNDAVKLNHLNKLIHPLVKLKFNTWLQDQQSAYVIREAAILIESGTHTDCDEIILVTAPDELRIERVMKRNGFSRKEVQLRMSKQWTDDQRRPHCSYILNNDEQSLLLPEIMRIHESLMV